MTVLLTGADLQARLRSFQYSVFRMETLQEYRGSGEDEWIAAFNAGHVRPPHDPVQNDWEAMIRAHHTAGRLMQRVHVVVEPLSQYLQFELTWAYAPNAAAGEDIRIIPVRDEAWPGDLPRHDFWLFDSSQLFDARYGNDGTWLGVEPVTDPIAIVDACRWRDAALYHGRPWTDYIRAHSSLAARLPVV